MPARYSEGERLLSSKIEKTIELSEDADLVRELNFTKLYECTRNSVVIEQYVRVVGTVIAGMLRAHTSLQQLRDTLSMMAKHQYDISTTGCESPLSCMAVLSRSPQHLQVRL